MDNFDLRVLQDAQAWMEAGHRVILGTVTRTWGSAPRPIGANVAIRDDARISGSVSGGCIEDELLARIRQGKICAAGTELLVFGVNADEAHRFGLPCGGTLEIFCEPLQAHSAIAPLLEKLSSGHNITRRVARHTGAATLLENTGNDQLQLNETEFISSFGPRWRLLIIGAGQMTHYLADMAQSLGYQVIVCDPRSEYADGFDLPAAQLTREMPDDVVREMRPDRHTAIVALTHDPKLDDMALLEALVSSAFYVGAIGSQVNQKSRRERLMTHFAMTEGQMNRLHGPVGIKNGARTPPEIAVSILAEITAVRYGYQIPSPIYRGDTAPLAGQCVKY